MLDEESVVDRLDVPAGGDPQPVHEGLRVAVDGQVGGEAADGGVPEAVVDNLVGVA